MRIDRSQMLEALHEFVQDGSGLIVGQPGAGKSHALGQIAYRFRRESRPHLFILVDELGDVSETDIQSALGYSEPSFREALQSLYSSVSEGGVVIFDGFDAARSPTARSRLLKVIRTAVRMAPPQWTVVVSVRTYDASKSPTLLEIFPRSTKGKGPYQSSLLTRHFVVPDLTDSEMKSALDSSGHLKELLAVGSRELRELVRNPFNLWLLENVLKAESDLEAITPLASQIELLLLFWDVRVRRGPLRDDKTVLLQEIVDLMVSEKTMALQKNRVFTTAVREPWESLLSSDVLKEAGPVGEQVAFSHNILFDFAVSLLAIQDSPSEITEFLREDVSRPLFLRPSLLQYFARLWTQDRSLFWEIFWTLLPSEEVPIRLVTRLLPPYVAVSEAEVPADFDPLFRQIANGDPIAPTAALRILQALRFVGIEDQALWVQVIDSLADTPSKFFAWEMARTLGELVDDGDATTDPAIGRIAGKLFDWAWTQRGGSDGEWYDQFASTLVLPILLTHGEASAIRKVVPPILELLSERGFPIRYFTTLCDNAGRLASVAPLLTEEVYERVFLHEETSEEPTPMGGVIIPMRSTRRQDFGLCHYQLEKEFPTYLKVEPQSAIRVALVLLDRLMQKRLTQFLKSGSTLEDSSFGVQFGDSELCLIEDFGDEWLPDHEEVKRMADLAQERLENDPSAFPPIELLSFYASNIRCGSVWSRLFALGAVHPTALSEPLSEIAVDPEFILHSTFGRGFVPFVEKTYGHWPESRRQAFERLVLDEEHFSARERWREALLRAIPDDSVLLGETRSAKGELADETDGDVWQTVERPAALSVEWDYDEELMERAGVDLSDPEIASWRETAKRLRDFSSKWHNEVPSEEDASEALSDLGRLRDAVPARSDAEELLVHRLWTAVAEAAETIARSETAKQEETFSLLRAIFLEAVDSFSPEAVKEPEEYSSLSWSPTPRIEAAQGLPRLLAVSADGEMQAALEELLNSPSPSERGVALLYLPHTRQECSDWFSKQVRKAAGQERSPGVARAVFRCLDYVGPERDEIARDLVIRWLSRCEDHSELRRTVGAWLAYLAFRQDDHEACAILGRLVEEAPTEGAELLGVVVVQGLQLLAVNRFAMEKQEVVARVVEWVAGLVQTIRAKIARASGDNLESWLSVAYKLVDRVVSRTYYNLRGSGDDGPQPAPETTQHYYQATRPILAAVVDLVRDENSHGMVPRTAHHFIQMMNEILPFEPQYALAMTRDVTEAAGSHGFHLDSLAVREVVKLVEALLADHREVLLDADALDDLLALLDQFAEVGWPEALQLVWRLDEIFR